MATPKSYEIIFCQHQQLGSNCRLCGVLVTADCEALKTYRYSCQHSDHSHRYMRAVRNKNEKAPVMREILANAEAVFDYLQTIVDKFEFSIETLALGIYLYNILLRNDGSRPEYSTQMEFYSSLCLMIAAKAIELDRHIPYYSRFIKYACKQHGKEEYESGELQLLEEFEWILQRPTFVTFLNFYLSSGVVFTDDEFCRKKVFLVEEKVKEFMMKMLRSGEFVLNNQMKLAALIIDDSRKEFKMEWHRLLEKYSGLTPEQFRQSDVLKPLGDLQTPLRLPKANITSSADQNKEQSTTASNDKQKECGSHLKVKSKPHIYHPLISNNQLKYVPSFTVLNLLSLKRTESSNN